MQQQARRRGCHTGATRRPGRSRWPEQVINWYYQNEQQLGEIQSVVLEEQVVDTVLQKAQVTDKKVAYEEAVKPAQPAQVEAGEAEEAKADE